MPWVRIDDQFYNHPKLAKLGPLLLPCVGLHVLALCYCNAYLTDGVIHKDQIPRLAGDLSLLFSDDSSGGLVAKSHQSHLIDRLVAAKLWQKTRMGYVIHDFLEYNPSREAVVQTRRIRAQSGQKGGRAKDLANAKQTPSKRLAKSKQKSAPSPSPFQALDQEQKEQTRESAPNGTALPLTQPFGEFGRVFLTPDQHHKLVAKLGEPQTQLLVTALDRDLETGGGKQSNGRIVKSAYATILKWSAHQQRTTAKVGVEGYDF